MRRMMKWIFFGVVVPVLILLGTVLIVFKCLPQEKLRHLAEQQLKARIHREVKIGPIHLGLRGLTVDELELSEIPNFKAGHFMTAKGVHLGWDPRILWQGLNFRQ